MMNFAHRGVCVCVKVCLNFLLQTELLLHGSCNRIIQLALILTTVSPLFQLSFHAAEPWQSSNTSSMCKLEECSPNVCLSNSLFSNFPNFAITGHWRQTEKQAQAILSIFCIHVFNAAFVQERFYLELFGQVLCRVIFILLRYW